MIWMLTATAAMFDTPEESSLPPLQRTWGGTEACDARALLVEAGERVEHPTEPELADDPQALLMRNLHVLDAWERARACGTVERSGDGIFAMYSAGQVLVAAARAVVDRAPRLAAERAVEAYAAGNDTSAGPLVAGMVGQALHLQALDVLAEVWPALEPAERARIAERLERLQRARPGLDLDAERAYALELAEQYWLEGTCLVAHEEAMGHAEKALTTGDRSLLDPQRAPSLSEWLTGCGRGIESVTDQWLEDEAELERQIAAL